MSPSSAKNLLVVGFKAWELMEPVARKLVEYDPDDAQWWLLWAQATRHASSLEAARLDLVMRRRIGIIRSIAHISFEERI